MSTIALSLAIEAGVLPQFQMLEDVDGEQLAMVRIPVGAGVAVFAKPRVLRAFADALVYAADLACKAEDALTDEPLPFEAAS